MRPTMRVAVAAMRATVGTTMRATVGTTMRATVGAMPSRRSFQFVAVSVIIGDTFFWASSYFISVFVVEFGMIIHFIFLLPICIRM